MRKNLLFAAALVLPACFAISACGSNGPVATGDEIAETGEAQPQVITPTETEAAEATPVPPIEPSKMTPPVAAVRPKDVIRGKGGLEEKCLARVAAETGAKVNGTNRIDESEAAIEIYVNVEGAQAPWKCHGYKNGTIDQIMYTGSEGAL